MKTRGEILSVNFSGLYNVQSQQDRRVNSVSVPLDRRTGIDRRQTERIALDPRLRQDIFTMKSAVAKFEGNPESQKEHNNNPVAAAFLSVIPFCRRIMSVQDAVNNHEIIKTIGKTGLMIVNSPEDTRDILKAVNILKDTKNGVASELDTAYQSRFSFFRGTLFEPLLKKMINSKSKKIQNIGLSIYQTDKTIFDTDLFKKLMHKLDVKVIDVVKSDRLDTRGAAIKLYKLDGRPLNKLIARAAMRVPLLSVGLIGLMELPIIVSEFCSSSKSNENIKDGTHQLAKSFINVTCVTAGAAITGAVLAKKGHIGSLAGIGLGSFVGSEVASEINKKID